MRRNKHGQPCAAVDIQALPASMASNLEHRHGQEWAQTRSGGRYHSTLSQRSQSDLPHIPVPSLLGVFLGGCCEVWVCLMPLSVRHYF